MLLAGNDRRRTAFTMLETLVVLVVLGVAVAMLIPQVRSAADSWRSRQSAGLIANDLETAFSLASRERKPVRLTCYCDQQRYVVTDRATGAVLLERKMGLTTEYGMKTMTFSVNPIDIFPPGSSSSGVTVTIAAQTGRTHTITLSQAGFVRIVN